MLHGACGFLGSFGALDFLAEAIASSSSITFILGFCFDFAASDDWLRFNFSSGGFNITSCGAEGLAVSDGFFG